MTETKLTQTQKARIYCHKYGHAKYYYGFFGYRYCGRCGDQIGDALGGIFPMANKMASPDCKLSPCRVCDPIIKKLQPFDRLIFMKRKKHPNWDTEKILRGIKIPMGCK